MCGVDHFSLDILTKIATNFGKDFNGKVVDLLHSRSDHQKLFFVMIPKNILNYPQRYMLVVGTPAKCFFLATHITHITKLAIHRRKVRIIDRW